MNINTKRLLYWLSRVLGILFAAFLSMFALDALTEKQGAFRILAALLIHLVPALVVVAALAAAWRRDICGGPLFLLGAVLYAVANLARPDWILLISGPLLLLSILFTASWSCAARPHSGA